MVDAAEDGGSVGGTHNTFLGHPLTSVIVGFILTGVIGWLLTNWYNERQKQNDIARLRIESGTAAAQDIARIAYRRYTRASMLYSAFLRDAELDEIHQRKKDYDEAYAEWGANLQSNLFVIRKLTGKIDYNFRESKFENALVSAFTSVDACLTKAYDARIREREALPLLRSCNMTAQLKRTLDLSYDVTDELFRVAIRDPGRAVGP